MKVKNKVFVLIGLLVSIFLTHSSLSQAEEVRGVTDKSIKIGAIFDQTGPAASITVPCTQAIRTYMRYINDHGGVNGRQLNLIVEDDRYSIPPAIAAFKKLVYRDRIFALIGPSSASITNILWRKSEQEKLPNIIFSTIEIVVNPLKRYLFTPVDTAEGAVRVSVDYMIKDYKLRDPRIGLVYPDTEAGKIDSRAALERLKRYNIEPVTKEIVMAGTIDASSQVMSLKKNRVNCAMHVGTITASAVTLLREMKKFGLKIPVFHSWGGMVGEEINTLGETARQFYGGAATVPWYSEGSGVASMREITLKYYPGTEEPYRCALYTNGWVQILMLVEGIKRAGKNLDAEAFVNALETLKNFDTWGLTGPITWGPNDHEGSVSCILIKADVDNGIVVPISDWRIPLPR